MVVPLRHTSIDPLGITIFLRSTSVAFIEFFVTYRLARPALTFNDDTFAESKQNPTKAPHH
jgi:hypothetical protein